MNIIFTVCTYNHIGRAFSLADSVAENCPGVKFVIGLVDEVGQGFNRPDAYEIVQAREMGLPYLEEMCMKYSSLELNSALKPYFAQYLLQRDPAVGQVIYLDSDILLYKNIDTLVQPLLIEHSIVISPHATASAPSGEGIDDRNFLRTGIYNAGFFAVKQDETGISFLKWWSGKLKDQCFIDAKRGLFAEQLWLNLLPLYFKRVCVLTNPGFNVAYWNLHERKITKKADGFYVNEVFPLIFYHFSGAGTKCIQEGFLSPHQREYTFENRPDVLPLFEQYVASLKNHSFDQYNSYYTVGSNFKTNSKLLSSVIQVSKKIVKRLRYVK